MSPASSSTTGDGEIEARAWYGWQTIAIDTIWIASLVAAAPLESIALAGLGAGVAVLGVPAIHLAHANVSAAVLSVGIRGLAGLLTAGGLALFIRDAVDDAANDSAVDGYVGGTLAVLGSLGFVGAIIFDAAKLGYETQQTSSSVTLVPYMHPKSGEMGIQMSLFL